MKYTKAFLKYFSDFPTFSSRDVKLFLRKNGSKNSYYKVFMHNMIKGNKVFVITRGSYTLYNDPAVGGFAFSPFYYGLETALTYHKLWDYATPLSIVTTNRVRNSSIVIMGRNANVRRIQKKYFFGYSMVQYDNNLYIPMADIEKTLIDSVYFHSRFSKGVYVAISKRVDKKRLSSYLKHYTKIISKQVNSLLD